MQNYVFASPLTYKFDKFMIPNLIIEDFDLSICTYWPIHTLFRTKTSPKCMQTAYITLQNIVIDVSISQTC